MATYHMWKDISGDFYWTLKSDENGRIITKSSESYESKQGAENSIAWTRNNAAGASYEDHTK